MIQENQFQVCNQEKKHIKSDIVRLELSLLHIWK